MRCYHGAAAIAAAIAAAALLAAGCHTAGVDGQLSGLTVGPDQRVPAYHRTQNFGAAWSLDTDHNGCRARDDVLARDLTQVRRRGCAVLSGVLHDPYTGAVITFSRDHPTQVQIDHVYPLGLAWRHGASSWTLEQRRRFANDPANLLAVDGAANEAKGDHGPSGWMPVPAYRCAYARRFVSVAAGYSLTVTAADRDALAAALATCRPDG